MPGTLTVTERMAKPSSRRGFIGGAGRLALGGAAALVGGTAALTLGGGFGAVMADNGCCGGVQCANGCPEGSFGNTYYCCAYDCVTHQRECHDCYTPAPDRVYICTWSTTTSMTCPCSHSA